MYMNMQKQLYAFGNTNQKIKPILLYKNKNQIRMLMNRHQISYNIETQTRRFKQPKNTPKKKNFINSQQVQIKNREAQGNEMQGRGKVEISFEQKQSKYSKLFKNQLKDWKQNCKKQSKYLKLFAEEQLNGNIVPKDNNNQSQLKHSNIFSHNQPQQNMYYTHFNNNRNRKEKSMLTIYKQRTEIMKNRNKTNRHYQRTSNSSFSRISFNKIKNNLCRHQLEDQQWEYLSQISKQQKLLQMMVKRGKNRLISLDYIEQEDFESDEFFRETKKGEAKIITYYQNLKGIQ